MIKLTQEEIEAIEEACLDDATRVIRYLKEEKERQRPYDLFLLIVTVVGAIGSVVAAVTGLILLL